MTPEKKWYQMREDTGLCSQIDDPITRTGGLLAECSGNAPVASTHRVHSLVHTSGISQQNSELVQTLCRSWVLSIAELPKALI